ncbi:MAG TPA: ASCH domain-containing protein [Kiritimatiellia bacterium]|nr:ASCH domain-containing protein [Kiritimatiellia bacterium]
MRNMSFSLTTAQVRAQTKDVTRRIGWADLKPGERLMAIEKGQGLKKGEKVRRITVIECVSNRKEMLCAITPHEVLREGFPDMSPADFVEMFCRANKCGPRDYVNRIEFRYVEVRHG